MEEVVAFDHRDRRVTMVKTPGALGKQHSWGRFYEAEMLDYIATLQLSGRYLDVGANIGNHTVFFELFCPSTHVDAFEPQPYMHAIFDGNVRVNGMTRTTLHRCGLGERHEVVTTPFANRTITFETQTLDSFGFNDVAVVKMDIEGMEASCLRGATATLRRCSPRLFIEASEDAALEAQSAILQPLGYSLTGRKWNASPTHEWVSITGGANSSPPSS